MKLRSKTPSSRTTPAKTGAPSRRPAVLAFVLSLALLLLSLPSLLAAPAEAPGGPNADVRVITVFSDGLGTDRVGLAYDKILSAAEVQQDFANLGAALHHAPAIPRIKTEAGVSTAEAEVSGLVDWNTGVVNLDALIRTFVRFNHFHVYCLFSKSFPLQSTDPIRNGPVTVLVHRDEKNGTVTDFEVFIDQSQVNPAHPPQVNRTRGLSWQVWVALGVIFLVVFASVFLLAMSILSRRKDRKA